MLHRCVISLFDHLGKPVSIDWREPISFNNLSLTDVCSSEQDIQQCDTTRGLFFSCRACNLHQYSLNLLYYCQSCLCVLYSPV